jgi:Ni/Fe-hydrogenase subunit HybB-like protein
MASRHIHDGSATLDMPGKASSGGAAKHHSAHHERPAALFGRANVPFFTPGVIGLTVLAAAGLVVLAVRLVLGLGAVTNLNDQYPWGIWIGIDVATGVALAAGGFTTAFIAHVLHHERYHVLVRPALLTATLGYTFVALGVCVDLGRYYNIWHVLMPSMWQGNSALFEVGMCVCCYLTVLYLEFMPIVCERFRGHVNLPGLLRGLNGALETLLRVIDNTLSRVMNFFIIMGVVLSCAHQSSLGTLMVIAPSKLHPLWHTAILPLQFLLSAFAVGLSMVVFESLLASRSLKRAPEMSVLSPFARLIPFLLTIYFGAKIVDMANRGTWHYLQEFSLRSVSWSVEIIVGILIPMAILLSHRLRRHPGWLFSAAAMVVFGVALNRFNVFIIGYTAPFSDKPYIPAWTEVLLTAGFIALLVLIYRLFIFLFPILPDEEGAKHA